MEFIEGLNDAQKEAVLHTEGPSLVIAGAGAGKTRVLTYRIANLLNKGVPGHAILALTFTNKAAREMKERISSVVGTGASRYLWMGTFHSIFSRILRTDGELLGYKSSFTIYDAADSKQVIRQVIKEMSLDDKAYVAGQISARISAAKNNLITAAMYQANQQYAERDKSNRVPLLGEIYKQYAARCFRANAMDFDDLLMNTNILFRDFPEVLRRYQEKFSYVLVDEYQDTNYAQYLIVKQLSALHCNLCVVGDDAQSIYSFRGARIENIFDFRNDYPGFKIFKLEQNYRSTKTIVKAANSIIDKNASQIRKTIFSDNEVGERIRVFQALTDSEEGVRVASDIFETHFSEQARWVDFAILYRTNAQSRIFEEMLRKKNIPYRVYGGLSFYERKEVKDILAYFRMIINPSDEEAFRRSVNYPRRGIGDTTLSKMYEMAGERDVSVWNIATDGEGLRLLFNAGTCSRIKGYVDLIGQFALRAATANAFTVAREVAAQTGILSEFREGKTVEDISRLENLEQLLNAIQEFSEAAETNGEPSTLDAYLATVALLTDQDTNNEDDNDRVTLMTVHSAKGLEFKYVYITGMEESLFPSLMSSGTAKELEEERRLFYVAVTRAMKRATLSYSLNRYKWGNLESASQSRFIREIDNDFIEEIVTKPRTTHGYGYGTGGGHGHDSGSAGGWGSDSNRRFSREDATGYKGSNSREKIVTSTSTGMSRKPGLKRLRPQTEEDPGKLFAGTGTSAKSAGGAAGETGATRDGSGSGSGTRSVDSGATGEGNFATAGDLSVGDMVKHERFGTGTILAIEGAQPNTTAVVDFTGAGKKKLLLRFAKLVRI